MKKEGFTLVEMIIVLATISALTIIMCVSKKCISESATVLKDKTANELNEQLTLYRNVYGTIPSSVRDTKSAVNFLHNAQLIKKKNTNIELSCKGIGNDFVFIARTGFEDNEKVSGNLTGWQSEGLSQELWKARGSSLPPTAGIKNSTKEKSWDFDTLQKAANILFR